MPYKDGTGPTGLGTDAGRGAGRCAGQGGAGRAEGRGLGGRGLGGHGSGGRGLGGRRRGFGGAATGPALGLEADADRSWIKDRLDSLQAAVHELTARFNALNKQ
jgi:hypothetical protein